MLSKRACTDYFTSPDTATHLRRRRAVGDDPLGGLPLPRQIETILRRRHGAGVPLPVPMSEEMSAGFGADFTGVRVHDDPEAARVAWQLQATAFTYGNDLYFSSGAYQPHTAEGRHLLAHELAHTTQPANAIAGPTVIGRADDPAERAADSLAAVVLRRQPARGSILAAEDSRPEAVPSHIRRVTFKRFTGFLNNWGWYSDTENALLKLEGDTEALTNSLERWCSEDEQVAALINQFTVLKAATIAEGGYQAFTKKLTDLQQAVRARRTEILNVRGRELGDTPTFVNHQPGALVSEVQSFLQTSGNQQELNPDSFRLSVPSKGYGVDRDEWSVAYTEAFTKTVREKVVVMRRLISERGRFLWTYTVDGILTIGAGNNTKHSVLAAGVDVWAAGIVQLKTDPALDAFLAWRELMKKAARIGDVLDPADNPYQEQAAEIKVDFSDIWKTRGYTEDGLLPDETTVVVDFDSGHYTPRGAWKKTIDAWTTLGYQVEFNPEGRTT